MTSVVNAVEPRALADRCPGLLRPHPAEDGLLVRLRIPGGQTTSAVLLELGSLAAEFGEGSVQLTSRGNVQLRGLDASRTAELVERVAAVGLLPSVTHERVRNIVASPTTGLLHESVDLRPMVAELDRTLCATPELSELPGRFLFALDDGTGDVASLRFDLAYLADRTAPDDALAWGTVLVGDVRHGIHTAADDAVPLMIDLARSFLRVRGRISPRAWHPAELADVSALDSRVQPLTVPGMRGTGPSLGVVGEAASVSVPLSLLNSHQLQAIDRAADGGPVVITPWRGVVIPGAAAALPDLAGAGLIVDDDSVWSQLTACIGAPGCAKSALSTRAMATELASALEFAPGLPVHLSGCARRCGAPSTPYVDLVAPESVRKALAVVAEAS